MSEEFDIEKEYINFLALLQSEAYRGKSKKIPPELMNRLNQLTSLIQEKRRQERHEKQKFKPYESVERGGELTQRQLITQENMSFMIQKKERVRPQYMRLLNEVFSPDCLNECILEFFKIEELLDLRLVSRTFEEAVRKHLPNRMIGEENDLASSIYESEAFYARLKELCISQIPPIFGSWLCLDRVEIKNRFRTTFSRDDLEQMKFLKNIPHEYDDLFAPFCVVFDLKPTSNQHPDGYIDKSWKKTFISFTSNSHFSNILISFEIVNIKEEKAMRILDSLNSIALSDDQIFKLSQTLFSVIDWCRTVVDSYLTRNIYFVRYPQRIPNYDELKFMNFLKDRSNYLRKVKSIARVHTDEMFLVDLSEFKVTPSQRRSLTDVLDEKLMKRVITFLEIEESIELRKVNRLCKKYSDEYICELTELSVNFYETSKFKYSNLYKKIPIIFELGFFSKAFLILESILTGRANFLSKNDLEEIRRIVKPSKFHDNLCRAFCILFRQDPVRKRIYNITNISDGSIELLYYPVVRNLLVNKNYRNVVKRFNIYCLRREELLEAEKILSQIDRKNVKPDSCFAGLYMLLKSILSFHKILNPLIYISYDYLQKRFPEDELEAIQEINSKFDDLMFFIRKSFALKLLNVNTLIIKSLDCLSEDEINYLNFFQKDYYDELYNIYNTARENMIEPNANLNQKIANHLFDILSSHENQDRALVPNLEIEQTKRESKEAATPRKRFKVDFKHINLYVIKNILDFLDLNDIEKFSRASKPCNEIYKIYIHYRIQLETELINQIEKENSSLIKSIQTKRIKFYNKFEIPHPSKENAISLLTQISAADIAELKNLKSKSEMTDICSVPFLLIFEDICNSKNIPIRSKKFSNWTCFQKLMSVTDFYRMISEFQVEVVQSSKIKVIEDYIDKNVPNFQEVSKVSYKLLRLMKWLKGLIEIHKFIRRFYVSVTDDEILDEDERMFAEEMDKLQLRSYMILRSMESFSPENHEKARAFMQALEDIENSRKNSKPNPYDEAVMELTDSLDKQDDEQFASTGSQRAFGLPPQSNFVSHSKSENRYQQEEIYEEDEYERKY